MNKHRSLRAESLESRQLLASNVFFNQFTNLPTPPSASQVSADWMTASPMVAGDTATVMSAAGSSASQMVATLLAAKGMFADVRALSTYSIDGTGNHFVNRDWGSTDTQLLRLTTAEYADGISAPAGADRPSAREVSNAIAAQTTSVANDRYLTDLVWLWGQFIDHDIDLTENADPAEPLTIEVPQGDSYFDPYGTGTVTIDFNRSVYDAETGDSINNPRQQINQITAFLDGSVVYGSDAERAAELRTFEGGKLKTSDGDLLPFNEAGLPNAGGTSDTLFLAGDVRANENAALTAMHTLFVREHNRLADEIAAANPRLSDEQIYQQARRIVTAEIQAITYNEFLPALLGEGAISPYRGYDPTVNPGIANIFSTAAYRFGHSMLSSTLVRLNPDGTEFEGGNLALADAFFSPEEITEHGIDSLLRGLASNYAQEIDNMVVDDVRNFLFGPPGAGGFDLASLNIQRGRDHGLPDYNQARVDMGLAPVTSFSQITSDPVVASRLEALYGNVNNIDVWVGGLAEDHVAGGSVGELIRTVLVDQFERIRDGDRFWYQRTMFGEQLRRIENTTLADIIQRNTDITGLQDNVFQDKPLETHRLATGRGGGNHSLGFFPRQTLDDVHQRVRHAHRAAATDDARSDIGSHHQRVAASRLAVQNPLRGVQSGFEPLRHHAATQLSSAASSFSATPQVVHKLSAQMLAARQMAFAQLRTSPLDFDLD